MSNLGEQFAESANCSEPLGSGFACIDSRPLSGADWNQPEPLARRIATDPEELQMQADAELTRADLDRLAEPLAEGEYTPMAFLCMAAALDRDGLPNAAHYMREAVRQIARATSSVPPGHSVVPNAPTEAMIEAGAGSVIWRTEGLPTGQRVAAAYRDMLAASPLPPTGEAN